MPSTPDPVASGRKRAFFVAFAVQVILGILILSSGISRGAVVWEVLGAVILVWAGTLAVIYRRSLR